MKFKIGGDIAFTLATMMRVINKVFPLTSSAAPNIIEASDDLEQQLCVCQHSFQNWT
jgi:hypothetical protein